MIAVSDAWKDVQQRFLLSESHIEIEAGVKDDEAMRVATVSGTTEAKHSNASGVKGTASEMRYATNELNLWALDGTRTLLPDSAPYANGGYVSDIESTGSVTLSFPAIRTTAVSGVTITWSNAYGEYPKVFTVIGRSGSTIVSEVTVTDNRDKVSTVFVPLQNYDNITIVVHGWDLPYRRVRMEKVTIGHTLTFRKGDLLSFTHEQDGDILSGKIPKYSIEFSLDNSDGRWDPNNPTGMAQYLSERQRLTLRYGLDIDGSIEWIDGGVFYLSEWSAPPNGLEARFVARDVFEFLLGEELWISRFQSLSSWVDTATSGKLPDGSSVVVDSSLDNHSSEYSPSYTTNTASKNAEIVQKAANAGCCILRYDRGGDLYVEPLKTEDSGYSINLALSYSYPEITLSKPLKEVSVNYGADAPYTLSVATNGEQQTVSNDFIRTTSQAGVVAKWVQDTLIQRKTVSGEFRADPRLDLYDVVRVEDRYGRLLTVVITNIKYTFNGSFRGQYTGRVLEEA